MCWGEPVPATGRSVALAAVRLFGMTRIVSGVAGGRTLAVPRSGTRPTSERVREALFSRLEHLGVVAGAHVLDLYAGTGALGLEALSRGARSAVLVEAARPAAELCRRNARDLGLPAEVVGRRVQTFLAEAPSAGSVPGGSVSAGRALGGRAPAALVLLDPPYDIEEAELTEVLGLLTAPGRLTDDAVVVVERSKRNPDPTWPPGLRTIDSRRYGDTVVWFAEPTAEG